MKYGRIKALRQHYPVAVICRVFEVSQSGYYAWRERPRSLRAQENARLEVEIRAAHQRTRDTCGPERLQSDLADYGIKVGVDRIRRIRKKLGLHCKQKRKFKVTPIPDTIFRSPPTCYNVTLQSAALTGLG